MGHSHSHSVASHNSPEFVAERQKYGITKEEITSLIDGINFWDVVKTDEDVIALAQKLRSNVETGLDSDATTDESLKFRRQIFGSGSLDRQPKKKSPTDQYIAFFSDETIASLRASKVHTIRHGGDIEMSVDDIVVGDIVVIDPGTKITPADGILIKGKLLINEANLTGEPEPVTISSKNRRILGGLPILSGGCTMLVVAVGKQALWARTTLL